MFFASWLAKILFSEAQGLPKYLSKYQRLWLVVESLSDSKDKIFISYFGNCMSEKDKHGGYLADFWASHRLVALRAFYGQFVFLWGHCRFFLPSGTSAPGGLEIGNYRERFQKRTQPTLAPSWSSQSSHHHILFTDRQKQFFFVEGTGFTPFTFMYIPLLCAFWSPNQGATENPFNCGNLRVLKLESTRF